MAWISHERASADGPSARAERLALRLHPHRVALLTAGLASFLVAALPLAGVALGQLAFARWQVALFAASVPLVLWAYALVLLATFFHPVHGLFGSPGASRPSRSPAIEGLLRGYASAVVVAFAVAPFVVLAAAL